MHKAVLVFLFSCLAQAAGGAADWPQWRGPDRNGISKETGWLDGWPEKSPPRVAWRVQVGKGHSAVSVRDGRAFTMGWDGQRDTVFCLDADSGKPLWKRSYRCDDIKQWPGPRATPTVDGNTVYTLGQWGQLGAWDVQTGAVRWAVRLHEDYNPDVDYGFAWSPLIEGDLLIFGTGRRGLAVRRADGKIAWGDDRKKGACVSAVPYAHRGQRGFVTLHVADDRDSLDVVGVEAKTGRELWRYGPWKERWGAMGVDPVVHDGKLFITSAQEFRQAARFSIAGETLREDWSTGRVASYTSGCVLLDKHLYLVDSRGFLTCLDWETGKEAWVARGFDERGTLIAADGKLLVQTGQRGELVVAAADPKGYREIRRAKVFEGSGATFTPPALAAGRIYCRSYEGEVVCLDLRR